MSWRYNRIGIKAHVYGIEISKELDNVQCVIQLQCDCSANGCLGQFPKGIDVPGQHGPLRRVADVIVIRTKSVDADGNRSLLEVSGQRETFGFGSAAVGNE